jgi:hypothetical protein
MHDILKNRLKSTYSPIKILAVVTMAVALLFACGMGQRAAAPPQELHVDVVAGGTQGMGSGPEPSAMWIAARDELDQVFGAQNALQLPAQDRKEALDVDFSTFRMLMVNMGQKPTAGYSLALDPQGGSISRQTAHITLIWTEPAPGMVTAQVVTHPFILLTISKGGFDSVKIVDQHGQTRFELSVYD